MKFWTVPRCFEGRTVAILAGGPNMSPAVACRVRDAGVPAIAINNTFRLAPWAWMLYAADAEWWQHRDNADARRFPGLKATCAPPGPKTCPEIADMRYLLQAGRTGFAPEPYAVRTGGNSGYQALHIAAHAGAARVLLCGFDMSGCHWHGPHGRGLKVTSSADYEAWREMLGALAPELTRRGVEVVNVTPDSALTCFRRQRLEDALAARAEPASHEPALSA